MLVNFIIYLVVGYINFLFASNIVIDNYSCVHNDVGFLLLPEINRMWVELTLIIAYGWFFTKWFFVNRRILSKFYKKCYILLFLRILFFTSTIIPSPLGQICIGRKNVIEPYVLIPTADIGNLCIDNNFSGHTVHMTLFTLFMVKYSGGIEALIYKLVLIPFILMVSASRIHYAIDIITGLLLTFLLFDRKNIKYLM
jgi:hypothetical protein